MDTPDTMRMKDAIPKLAASMQSVLTDAQIQILEEKQLDIRFDGLPAWKISVTPHPITQHYQMIETYIDLFPLCLASMSTLELQRLAASENLGLRGVTVIPLRPEDHDDRSGLRVRSCFVGKNGDSDDEVENLAIDILTVLTFARTLEDRVTDNTIAGEFSFELYNSRFESPSSSQSTRFVTTGQKIFDGSHDRVFAEVMKVLKPEFAHELRQAGERTAIITASADRLEIVAKIPSEIPMFIAHAPLLDLSGMTPPQLWELLEVLNSNIEAGHFEANPTDMVLNFTAWKHLTNDMRQFSFDHAIVSVNRAFKMASKNIQFAPVQMVGGAFSNEVLSLKNAA